MKKKSSYLFFLPIFFLLLSSVPLSSHAATLSFGTEPHQRGTRVSVRLDTEGQAINAVEGHITIKSNLPASIETGRSFIPFWVVRPTVRGDTVEFSGIVPGGYEGIFTEQGLRTDGELFSMIFSGAGEASLGFSGVTVLLNDGEGTAARVSLKDAHLVFDGSGPDRLLVETDREPPEDFDVIFVDGVAPGKPVIAFTTRDSKTGVSYFEVKEPFAPWHRVESPYQLTRTIPWKVKVRAVDAAGNARIVEAIDPERTAFFAHVVIVLGVIMIFVVMMRLRVRA